METGTGDGCRRREVMIFMGEEMDERDERTASRASWVGTAAGRWQYGLEMGCAMVGAKELRNQAAGDVENEGGKEEPQLNCKVASRE